MSSKCFLPERECKFVIDVIDSLRKLLVYVNPGRYGNVILNFMVFESSVEQKETVKLDWDGYVVVVYRRAFKEPYPSDPTPEQKEQINAIWEALGRPDKKLA